MKNYYLLLMLFVVACGKKYETVEERFYAYTFYANKAELCIVNDQLEIAKLNYDTLFAIDIAHHAREKYNYGILVLKMGDTISAMKQFEDLYNLGYGEKYPFINKYSSQYSISKKNAKDKALYNQCSKMFERDQIANGKQYFDNEEYFKVVMENISKMKEMFRTIKERPDSKFNINTSQFILPIIHYYQFKSLKNGIKRNPEFVNRFPIFKHLVEKEVLDLEFEKLLKECMYDGRLSRYALARYDTMEGINLAGNVVMQYNNYQVILKPDNLKDSIRDVINTERRKLYLEDFSDYYSKVVYDSKIKNDGLIFPIRSSDKNLFKEESQKRQEVRDEATFYLCDGYMVAYGFKNDEQAKEQANNFRSLYLK